MDPFEVGEIYANRNGSYVVVSLNRPNNQMEVRYLQTGETASLEIDLQQRIWENLRLEELRANREVALEEARYIKGFGEQFSGLLETDFKRNTEGTRWRSRLGLAGRVARILSEEAKHTFTSWSIYRWPVAFLTHRENYDMAAFELGSRKAKFTIELNEDAAHYGFYIERNYDDMDQSWDWPRLVAALNSEQDLINLLDQVESGHELKIIGRVSNGRNRFHYTNGLDQGAVSLWDEVSPKRTPLKERLDCLVNIPSDLWGELYIMARTSRSDAIQAGVGFAQAVADVMVMLLPVYWAAVSA